MRNPIDPDAVYSSPILLDLVASEMVPVQVLTSVCATCPVSLWYMQSRSGVTCFCSALHRETWTGYDVSQNYVAHCDGREQALAKLTPRDSTSQ